MEQVPGCRVAWAWANTQKHAACCKECTECRTNVNMYHIDWHIIRCVYTKTHPTLLNSASKARVHMRCTCNIHLLEQTIIREMHSNFSMCMVSVFAAATRVALHIGKVSSQKTRHGKRMCRGVDACVACVCVFVCASVKMYTVYWISCTSSILSHSIFNATPIFPFK